MKQQQKEFIKRKVQEYLEAGKKIKKIAMTRETPLTKFNGYEDLRQFDQMYLS